MAIPFLSDVRLPAGAKLYLWTGNDVNYLTYNSWYIHTGSDIILRNTSTGPYKFQTNGANDVLTLDSSQKATFHGLVEFNAQASFNAASGETALHTTISDNSDFWHLKGTRDTTLTTYIKDDYGRLILYGNPTNYTNASAAVQVQSSGMVSGGYHFWVQDDGGNKYFKIAHDGDTTITGDVSIAKTADVGVLNVANLDSEAAVGLSLTYPTSNVAAGDGLAIAIGIAGRGRSYIANSNVTNNLDASNLIFYTEGGGTIVEALKIDTNQNITIGAGKKLFLDGSDNTYIYESGDGVIDFYGDNAHLVSMKQNGTQSEVVVNESSGDVDFRVESNNSTHAFFVEAEGAGKVGIGESDPEVKLEVAGDILAKDSYVSCGLGATDGYQFHDFGSGYGLRGITGGVGSRISIYTNATERFYIDLNGAANFSGAVTVEGSLALGKADTASGHINAKELMTFNIDTDNDDTNRYFAWYTNGADGSGTELLKILETGAATFSGNVTLGSSSKASDEWMYIDSDSNSSAGIQLLRGGLSKWFIYNPGGGNNFKIYDNSGGGYMEMAVGGNATFSADILTNTDSSSDIGKTGERWANIWVDNINGATPLSGDYLPLAGGTMTGHVLFNDGIELRLGADTDMGLFSSSGTSHIRVNEGIFALRANDLRLMNQANNESYIRATANAGVLLYYDNSNVLETVAIGSQTKFDGGGAAIGHTIHNEGTAVGDDAKIAFETQAAMDWAIGIDRSDSNKFKLSQSENLGTNDRLEITSAGVATFASDIISGSTSKQIKGFRRWQMDANNDFGINNASAAQVLLITGGGTPSTSTATFAGNVEVDGNLIVDGTTTTINSTTITVDDKNIELGSVASPSDTTADGGGITLKGASDKTILWTNSTDSWDFNQHVKTSGIFRGDTLNNAANSANIIYRSGTTTIVGNAAAGLVITDGSSGGVGIGTATPQKRLHIEHAAGASEGILISGASDTVGHTAGILFRAEGGEADSALRAKGAIFYEREAGSYGVGKLLICNTNSANNVSATVSDVALTINADKSATFASTIATSGVGGDGTPVIDITGSGSATFNWITKATHANLTAGEHAIHIFGKEHASKNSAHIGFTYNSDHGDDNTLNLGFFGVNDILNVTAGGKVGIGITAPIQKLDTPNIVIGGSTIAGTYRANALFIDNNAGVSRFYSAGADGSTKGSYQFNIMASDANPLSTPLTLNADDSATFAGSIGIGSTASDFHADADDLVVGGGSGNTGITIHSGTGGYGSIFFADGTADDATEKRGQIRYLQGTERMDFHTDNVATAALSLAANGNATFAGNITTSSGTSSIYNRIKITNNGSPENQLNIGQWDGANHRIEGDSTRPIVITSYQGNINLGISGGTTLNVHSSGIVVTGQMKATTGWFLDNVYMSGGQLYIGASGANATTDQSHRLMSGSGILKIQSYETDTWTSHLEISTSGVISGNGSGLTGVTSEWDGSLTGSATIFNSGNGNSPILHVKDTADTFVALFESNRAGDTGSNVHIRHWPTTAQETNRTHLFFEMKDDGNNVTKYGTIGCYIDDHTGGTEDGNLRFNVMKNGTSTEIMRIDADSVTIENSLAAANPLLRLYNNTNGGGSTIEFSDQASSRAQKGKLTFYHADGSSQGGGAIMQAHSTEADFVFLVGDGTNKGRYLAKSDSSTAEVDYGFYGDIDTGMYQAAADQLGLVAAGSRKLLVNSNGVHIQNGELYVNNETIVGETTTGRTLVGSKTVTLTDGTYTTGLTVVLASHKGCYVKVFMTGDWSSHSAIAYLGEFFLQNGAGGYAEPGMIIREVDNTQSDSITAKIVDPSGTTGNRSFVIQFLADDNVGSHSPGVKMTYEVMGDFVSVS